MQQVVLWLNMIAFALLLTGIGAELLAWLRKRETWRSLYISYAALFALYLLIQTFGYFNLFYVRNPMSGLLQFVGLVRTAVSIALAVVIPSYTAYASGLRPRRILLFIPAAFLLVGVAISFGIRLAALSIAMNLAFNAFVAVISLLGLSRIRRKKSDTPKSEVLPFLILSAALYAFLLILGTLMTVGVFAMADPLITVGANGLFCLSWGLLLLVSAFRRAAPAGGGASLDGRFVSDYSLSSREAEVAELLVQGLSARQVAERLFISTRTVETHIYNLYRKSGCRSKVDLINKARSYPGPT